MKYGNPFCDEGLKLVQIVSKQALIENSTSLEKCAREIGLNQFDSFFNDRLQNGTVSLYDNIRKQKFAVISLAEHCDDIKVETKNCQFRSRLSTLCKIVCCLTS